MGEKKLVEYKYEFVPARKGEPAWDLIPKNQLYKTSEYTLECPNKFRCRSDVYSVSTYKMRDYKTKKTYVKRYKQVDETGDNYYESY